MTPSNLEWGEEGKPRKPLVLEAKGLFPCRSSCAGAQLQLPPTERCQDSGWEMLMLVRTPWIGSAK